MLFIIQWSNKISASDKLSITLNMPRANDDMVAGSRVAFQNSKLGQREEPPTKPWRRDKAVIHLP